MTQMWRAFGELLPMLLVLGCLFLVVLAVLPALPRQGQKLALRLMTVVWLVGVCIITLWPRPQILSFDGNSRPLDVVPIMGLFDGVARSSDRLNACLQMLGNVALFVPGGAIMGALCARRTASVRIAALSAAGIALTIEYVQWLLASGRVASINDVLLATLGSAAGAGAGSPRVQRWLKSQAKNQSVDSDISQS